MNFQQQASLHLHLTDQVQHLNPASIPDVATPKTNSIKSSN